MAGRESDASTKVQEAAASVQQVAATRKRISGSKAEGVARRYWGAIAAGPLVGGVDGGGAGGGYNVRGRVDVLAPEGIREFIGELIGAVPDLHMEVLSTTSEGDRCGVQWRLRGTFAGPGSFGGVAPTGTPIDIEGFDLITVENGLIVNNDAYTDSMTFARQVRMMPPQASPAEQRMMSAFNAKTRLTGSLAGGEAELVAENVWVIQGQPARCNVYLIQHDGGVTLFDAGARTMTRAVATAAARLGGIRQIVLGHGHTDHRGTAPGLGAPVLCHPREVEDAEGSGGWRYWPADLSGIPFFHRQVQKLMHRYAWDGGPVKISGTLSEGDEVVGFKVIELPGHAPGQIGLWREEDRLALTSDCFYTLDIWGRDSAPHIPFPTYNHDTEQARESMRKLAELEPAAAWPGHAKPLTGDVRGQLLKAVEAA